MTLAENRMVRGRLSSLLSLLKAILNIMPIRAVIVTVFGYKHIMLLYLTTSRLVLFDGWITPNTGKYLSVHQTNPLD